MWKVCRNAKEGSAGLKTEAPLIVYKKDGSYTDEVREIYGL
jgi:tRNA1(Val) A37 N6-methylase TrmN6